MEKKNVRLDKKIAQKIHILLEKKIEITNNLRL